MLDFLVNEMCPKLYPTISFMKTTIKILQYAAPIILVLFGLFDVVRSVTSQKEEDIKKAQQTFVRRIVAGVAVFLVIPIAGFALSIVAKADDDSILSCLEYTETSGQKES